MDDCDPCLVEIGSRKGLGNSILVALFTLFHSQLGLTGRDKTLRWGKLKTEVETQSPCTSSLQPLPCLTYDLRWYRTLHYTHNLTAVVRPFSLSPINYRISVPIFCYKFVYVHRCNRLPGQT